MGFVLFTFAFMKEKFLQFIADHRLITTDTPVLLAVSGGVDSMVMAHLFVECSLPFAIAHCNFQLRGKEALEDEQFVRKTARKLGVKFHCRKFDTFHYAEHNHLSIQVAARNLRYSWFGELTQKYHYQSIVTAHHAGDEAETFFINLLRGTGLKGLSGIPVKQGKIIRPLLFCSRTEIEKYAASRNISWRNDSSNDELYYLRNQIRLQLLPLIRNIQPHFDTIMQRNLERLSKENHILQEKMEEDKSKVLNISGAETRINIEALLSSSHHEYLLGILLEPFGFSMQQVKDIQESLSKQSGRRFETGPYRLIRDREYLIIIPKLTSSETANIFTIEIKSKPFNFSSDNLPYTLKFKRGTIAGNFKIDSSPATAQLDLGKLTSPLVLRKWKAGDSLYPLGMKGRKKVSDLLTDLKFSLPQKDNTWVLCSGEDVIWIPGIRISEKFKISKKTTKILTISLLYI